MSRSLQWNAVAYMIVAALLASLFFSFNLSMNSVSSHKRAADVNYPLWLKTKTWIAPAGGHAADHPLSSKSGFQPVTVIPKSPSAAPAASTNPAVPAAKSVPAVTEKVSAPVAKIIPTYKVTSYYLNVRALPNAESKILKAVKMGTLLKVKAQNANGWLTLEGGGYVHGGYAVPVTGELAGKQAASSAAGAAVSLAASTGAATLLGADTVAPIQAKQAAQTKAAQTKASVTKIAAHNDTPAGSAANEAGNPRKPTSKVMSDSGLTKAHIAALLKGTKLQGFGLEEVILGVEKQYGINAFFTIAVMKLESGNGKSTISRTKNNLFGLNAVTGNARKKAFSFATKGDSIRKFGQLINDNYVAKGFTTIDKVARKYCPANGLWAGHVRTIMRGDFGKLT